MWRQQAKLALVASDRSARIGTFAPPYKVINLRQQAFDSLDCFFLFFFLTVTLRKELT